MEKVGMSSVLVHHNEVSHHHESASWVQSEKALKPFSYAPLLPCLPLHFNILKWTLKTTPNGAR